MIEIKNNKYKWLDKYALSLDGAKKQYQPDWEAFQFKIKEKLFAYTANYKHERPIITLKGRPFDNEILKQKYEDIVEGYHMNKKLWITVYLDGNVPDNVLKELISGSHGLILKTFPKKIQEEIKKNK